ncbi:WD repeat-containing protein 11-like isoform X2 [Hibiscus syriacus]|uniref:WD repeat-containing protein 11-like isoform X2 n=1 Tax=Hibiscus syriacus TaxID=106335 RepID=A0A6A2X309_HIBSY|nr:WD repeat-containing protein 11-like isoform X2 [Hibiscus syriacus]
MSIPIPRPLPNDSWDSTLPGPPTSNNFGSADLSPSGLLAFAFGSSVSVVDSRSLQLFATIPLPPPSSSNSSSSLSPFVTSVRWTPLPLGCDLLSTEPSSSHLILAAADRHGRIALLDFRLRSLILSIDPPDPSSKFGVQDLCWVQARSDSFHLASLRGPSYLSLYNTSSSRCIFKYDASPEYLSLLGEGEDDIALKKPQIRTDCTELLKLEKDAAAGGGGGSSSSSSSSPVSAVFPLYAVRLAFSPHWKNVIYVAFPKELVVFGLKYETTLLSATLPRGCPSFLMGRSASGEERNKDFLFPSYSCNIWHSNLYLIRLKRLYFVLFKDHKCRVTKLGKRDKVLNWGLGNIHVMCTMEELMPSIGSPVPSPSVLAVLISQSQSTLQNINKLYSNSSNAASDVDFDNPFEFCDDTLLVAKAHLISISDDGKLWSWILTAEGNGVIEKDVRNSGSIADVSDDSTNTTVMFSKDGLATKGSRQLDNINGSRIQLPNSTFGFADVTFKYSRLLATELEKQRQNYESMLAEAKSKRESTIAEAVEKAVTSEMQDIQSNLDKCTEEKNALTEVNRKFIKDQQVWRNKVKEIEEREASESRLMDDKILDLEEQIRDLKVYIEAQKTLVDMTDSDSIRGGTVLPVPSAQSSSANSRRHKKSGRRQT